jgi:hypothetical protein
MDASGDGVSSEKRLLDGWSRQVLKVANETTFYARENLVRERCPLSLVVRDVMSKVRRSLTNMYVQGLIVNRRGSPTRGVPM